MDALGTPGTFDGCAAGVLPVTWEVPFLLWQGAALAAGARLWSMIGC